MKNYILSFVLLSLLCLSACIDDKGNYDYIPAGDLEVKVIAGMDKEYIKDNMQQLEITPIFNKMENETDYDFCWYAYPATNPQKIDTLSYERNLNYRVTLATGEYKMVYRVRNKATGICLYQQTQLKVASVYNDIWIVMKDDGEHTDIDVVNADGEIYTDVLAQVNYGDRPLGTGIRAGYIYDYEHLHTNPDGTTVGKKHINGLMIMTSEEARIYDMDNMGLLKSYKDCFFGPVPAGKPMWCCPYNSLGYAMVIGGKIYVYRTDIGATGTFSLKAGIYECHKGIIPPAATSARTFVFFDETTQSLLKLSGNDERVSECSEIVGAARPCKNLGCELKYMEDQCVPGGTGHASGLALFHDTNSGICYTAELTAEELVSGVNPIKSFRQIPTNSKLGTAEIFAANQYQPTLYFVNPDLKNELWSFDFTTQKEVKQVDFAAGEEIAYAKQVIFKNSSGEYSRVMAVLTNMDGKWKLNLLNFIGETQDINATSKPLNPPTGIGNGRHVIFKNSNSMPM